MHGLHAAAPRQRCGADRALHEARRVATARGHNRRRIGVILGVVPAQREGETTRGEERDSRGIDGANKQFYNIPAPSGMRVVKGRDH